MTIVEQAPIPPEELLLEPGHSISVLGQGETALFVSNTEVYNAYYFGSGLDTNTDHPVGIVGMNIRGLMVPSVDGLAAELAKQPAAIDLAQVNIDTDTMSQALICMDDSGDPMGSTIHIIPLNEVGMVADGAARFTLNPGEASAVFGRNGFVVDKEARAGREEVSASLQNAASVSREQFMLDRTEAGLQVKAVSKYGLILEHGAPIGRLQDTLDDDPTAEYVLPDNTLLDGVGGAAVTAAAEIQHPTVNNPELSPVNVMDLDRELVLPMVGRLMDNLPNSRLNEVSAKLHEDVAKLVSEAGSLEEAKILIGQVGTQLEELAKLSTAVVESIPLGSRALGDVNPDYISRAKEILNGNSPLSRLLGGDNVAESIRGLIVGAMEIQARADESKRAAMQEDREAVETELAGLWEEAGHDVTNLKQLVYEESRYPSSNRFNASQSSVNDMTGLLGGIYRLMGSEDLAQKATRLINKVNETQLKLQAVNSRQDQHDYQEISRQAQELRRALGDVDRVVRVAKIKTEELRP